MPKVFFDTNILVYAADEADPRKKERARELMRTQSKENEIFISTQVLQEYYVAVTKKLGIEALTAKELLRSLERFSSVVIEPNLIAEAIDISILHKLSFWDSLIVAAADSVHCESLFSEDFSDGQIIRGLRIVNPFMVE
jgi:predicted nucleic acid-binding protein